MRIFLESWNMNSNVWLKECVYKRVGEEGKSPGFKSTQVTFLTSAMYVPCSPFLSFPSHRLPDRWHLHRSFRWHGVNPCYILTFVLLGFEQALGREMRKVARPWLLPPASPAPTPSIKSAKPSEIVTPDAPPASHIKLSTPPPSFAKRIYDLLGTVTTITAINFAVAPFMLLNVRDTFAVWKATNYYGFFMVLGPMLLLRAGAAGMSKRGLRRREKSAGAKSQ